MTKPLKEYHISWLSVHPEYDERWLKSVLKKGFDVHHVDCDKTNNNPANLLLIECRDHMALHGSPNFSRMAANISRDVSTKDRSQKAPKTIVVYGFDIRLKVLGLNKVTFGNRIGIHKNTVNKWGDNLPFYAYTILTMLEDVAALQRQCDGWMKPNTAELDKYESRLDIINKEMQKYNR